MFTNCVPGGCGFSRDLSPPMKFANRYSARCITVTPFQPTPGVTHQRIVQDACAEGGDLMAQQSWRVEQHNTALQVDTQVKFVQTYAGRTRCLTVPREPYLTANTCAAPTPWWQSFRIQRVATVTCEQSRDGICGMPSPAVIPRN